MMECKQEFVPDCRPKVHFSWANLLTRQIATENPTQATRSIRFRSRTPGKSHRAPMSERGRLKGNAALTTLIELLLIGFALCGIFSVVPLIVHSSATKMAMSPSSPLHNVFRLATTTNGKLWIQRGLSEIVTVEIATGQTRTVFRQSRLPIFRSFVSDDGSTSLLSLDDHEILVYQDQNLLVSETVPCASSVEMALSANGQFAVLLTNGTHMQSWDLGTLDPTPSDFELSVPAERIALDPAGEKLLTATQEGELILYDARSGRIVQKLHPGLPLTGDPLFSPDGSRLVIARDQSVEQYDMKTLNRCWKVVSPDHDEFKTIAMSPDGSKIATADCRNGIQILDSTDGHLIHKIRQDSFTNKIAFAISSQTLYSAGLDGLIRSWSIASGLELEPLKLIE